MTTREKKLLYLWPVLWPACIYLVLIRHHGSGWWRGFFYAIALQVAAIALYKLSAIAHRFYHRRHALPYTYASYYQSINRIERSRNTQHETRNGFTLIELLTVIAIIGLLVALVAPVLRNFSKGDVTVAATRQMLDDCARARQLAISQRTTVFMVFVPTNFWQDPLRAGGNNQWQNLSTLAPKVVTSTLVTQLYNAQWDGYVLYSLRAIGDQPGRYYPKDLSGVKTLPAGSFITPLKFTAPMYPAAPFLVQTNFAVYGFLRTNAIPFPTTDALTNVNYANQLAINPTVQCPTVPFIAFNYLGQLCSGNGSVLPYDEYIPLSYGTIVEPHGPNHNPVQAAVTAAEEPPGNSTNISYNLIHIDRLTGRARLETAAAQ